MAASRVATEVAGGALGGGLTAAVAFRAERWPVVLEGWPVTVLLAFRAEQVLVSLPSATAGAGQQGRRYGRRNR